MSNRKFFDNFIKPWSKESDRILQRITKKGRADVFDVKIPREFGRRCPHLTDNGLLEIARIDKKNKAVIMPGEDVRIVPRNGKYFFFKIE